MSDIPIIDPKQLAALIAKFHRLFDDWEFAARIAEEKQNARKFRRNPERLVSSDQATLSTGAAA